MSRRSAHFQSCRPFSAPRCYDAQHLQSGAAAATVVMPTPRCVNTPTLRHLHGHCVVCYTVQCRLVLVVVVPEGDKDGDVIPKIGLRMGSSPGRQVFGDAQRSCFFLLLSKLDMNISLYLTF